MGFYSSADLNSFNLLEACTSSEVDLHNPSMSNANNSNTQNSNNNNNNNQAFELALDSSSIDNANLGFQFGSNQLSFFYVSSLTNRICIMNVESILNMYKLKSNETNKIKYKCENLACKKKLLNPDILNLVENANKNLISDLLYSK